MAPLGSPQVPIVHPLHSVVTFFNYDRRHMRFLVRLRSAISCLLHGYAAVPLSSYTTICISEETLLLTSTHNQKSVEVALWALERPEHYWKATALGQDVHAKAIETLVLAKVED
jgi:hypothetical protein